MSCAWSEGQVHRYAEGTLDTRLGLAFERHLTDCADCRARLDAARRLEELLRAEVTPLPAPPSLVGRVATAVAVERERERHAGMRLLARLGAAGVSLLPRGRRTRLALTAPLGGLAVALALIVGAFALSPDVVGAVVQRALTFIPGLGIRTVDEGNLVALRSVSGEELGATLTVGALLSDGKQTTVEFGLTGLPGGKSGWDRQDMPADHTPVLRDGQGREYRLTGGYHSTGGSEQENHIDGRLFFRPLPGDLASVDLVVPVDYFVPTAVLPGADGRTWTLQIPLAPPSQAGLPAASPQTATATARGVTLRIVASTFGPDRTVLQVEGETAGPNQLLALWPNGGNATDFVSLRDDRGRVCRLLPEGLGPANLSSQPLRRDLYFEPLASGAQSVILVVEAVQVVEPGEASVTVPLAGRQVGETFELDRAVRLGQREVRLTTATLGEERDEPWLYLDANLGATVDGRTLSSFSVESASEAWMFSMGSGAQLDRFGVPVEPGQREATLRLTRPTLNVEGPWKLTIPVVLGSK